MALSPETLAAHAGDIESILHYIAMDDNDVAINSACHCNFCHSLSYGDYNLLGHEPDCLYLLSRTILGLSNEDTDSFNEEGDDDGPE